MGRLALPVFVTIYVSVQIDAPGTAFETCLGVNSVVGTVLGFAVVMADSTGGGLLAVVWSDVFQGTLLCLGLVLLSIVGLCTVGSWGRSPPPLRAAVRGGEVSQASARLGTRKLQERRG